MRRCKARMKVRQRKTSRATTSLHVQLDRLIESIGGRKFTAAERNQIARLIRAMFDSGDSADCVWLLEMAFGAPGDPDDGLDGEKTVEALT